ncbi:PREDICTED: conserved [Prunus dulcis]|uniref:PREDICTED: conserved n=1 Tax=Prunus dulcis TaxID=3755 RepID=A0A5E4E984_PRUDU|nr:PREDICTED: conserved [Prunus dulcis]
MDDIKNNAVPQMDDTLSFCDFSLYNDDYDNYSPSPRQYPDTPESFFEFLVDPDFEPDSSARDPRNGLFLFKTNSFKRSHSFRSTLDLAISSPFKPSSPATGSCRYQSSKSRKHKMVLIGSLVKPQPKMELRDIKRRQSRRVPKPMFPVANATELVAAAPADGGGALHKGLLRPLRCRAHLVSALVKASFGCIPSPKPV